MRGTDGANTVTPPTTAAILQEIDDNSVKIAAILQDTDETLPGLIGISGPTPAEIRVELDTNSTKLALLDAAITSRPTPAEIRTEMDSNSTKLTNILEDTNTSIPTAILEATRGSGPVDVNAETLDDSGEKMYYKTASGDSISGALVHVYVKSEYDMGIFDIKYRTTTVDDVGWLDTLSLFQNVTYLIKFSKTNFDTEYHIVTVSA
jgi:hypothetical protein